MTGSEYMSSFISANVGVWGMEGELHPFLTGMEKSLLLVSKEVLSSAGQAFDTVIFPGMGMRICNQECGCYVFLFKVREAC